MKDKLYRFFHNGITCDIKRFKKNGGIIGKNCEISSQVEFGTEPYLIKIGDNVRITQGVKFITHDGGVWVLRNLGMKDVDVFGTITIGNNVNIGWDVIIMPNVHIGNNCVIGAGAIVTKDIPDNSVVVGVPARIIENIEQYREKILLKCDYTKNMKSREKMEYLIKKYKI